MHALRYFWTEMFTIFIRRRTRVVGHVLGQYTLKLALRTKQLLHNRKTYARLNRRRQEGKEEGQRYQMHGKFL